MKLRLAMMLGISIINIDPFIAFDLEQSETYFAAYIKELLMLWKFYETLLLNLRGTFIVLKNLMLEWEIGLSNCNSYCQLGLKY